VEFYAKLANIFDYFRFIVPIEIAISFTFEVMSSIFRFKQFQIDQANCAMKINTDGVLLGSMVESDTTGYVLDIGTGTGVIAMMLAQKLPMAKVHAIELDPAASIQAGLNFTNSTFSDRLEVFSGSFQEMVTDVSYDLIVSNPPFYTNSLRNPDPRRTLAKHTDDVFFEELIKFVDQNLSYKGKFYCILPPAIAAQIRDELLQDTALYYNGSIEISSFSGDPAIRSLIQISREDKAARQEKFVIYVSKGEYTSEYKALLKPYFLNF